MLNSHDPSRHGSGPPEPLTDELAEAIPEGGAGLAALARRWALRLASVVLLTMAAVVLWREFHQLSLAAVVQSMNAWGHGRILLAIALSAFSFFLMGVVEWLGVRWSGASMPWGPVLAGSFVANAIAHSVGANLLVSGALRARLYDRYGVTLAQVAATTLFSGMSFAVGVAALGGAGLALSPARQIAATAIPLEVARSLGWALMVAVAAYVILCGVRKAPLRAYGRSLTLPSAGDAMAQLVIGIVDNGVAAAIIWLLMTSEAVHYQTFVGAYAVSAVAGLVSTVPGGAGVFEGSISALLPNASPAPLAAAFLGYRLVYYLLPLLVACLALAGDTIRRRGR
ncbi:lysylphosphatidylglycerol synthase domain-containing protein [Phenylobacterium sp. LjRoot225]|uniref:lysylphosphatidylglycerol synthase domain-containing protein n=1 Tax=Phenylobacterium sp. LjRoot225 TaxID=3342285 RepID=UPI003ECDC119